MSRGSVSHSSGASPILEATLTQIAKVNVLITGSLHLVGAALSILDDYDGVLHKKKPDE